MIVFGPSGVERVCCIGAYTLAMIKKGLIVLCEQKVLNDRPR